jgi:hypothetical protein
MPLNLNVLNFSLSFQTFYNPDFEANEPLLRETKL